MSTKANTSKSDVEDLGEDNLDEDGFIEGDIDLGNVVSSFSFGTNSEPVNLPIKISQQLSVASSDSRSTIAQLYGITPIGVTPPVDGEAFSLKRGYQLRPSTVRKLNELKSKHPGVNVYLNTILDAAILHYYKYIFNENGHF